MPALWTRDPRSFPGTNHVCTNDALHRKRYLHLNVARRTQFINWVFCRSCFYLQDYSLNDVLHMNHPLKVHISLAL